MSDFPTSIRDEAMKTGFPLELRIASILQARDYLVAHNLYYVDHDEGKGRELDLRALKGQTFQNGTARYTVRLCVLAGASAHAFDKSR